MKVSERVNVMKKNFMTLHNDGLSIGEIAEKHNLSAATVYRHLQEIADENHVTRDSLLEVLRTLTERQYVEQEKRFRADIKAIMQGFEEVVTCIDEIQKEMRVILEEENFYA